MTFGVYGPTAQTSAFRATVDDWNGFSDGPEVRLEAWPTHEAFRRAVESGTDLPDVFLTSRSDLRWLLDKGLTRPVDELLDERGVDFGDDYSRDALEAFSADDRLQCMPYGVSPMVIYYNTRLVNFARMQRRGLDAPDPDATGWSFDQFAAAAQFASRHPDTKGVHISPTLEGLAPFVESGGGSVFDDDTDPKSLAFSTPGSQAALDQTLQVLRDPQVTLDTKQLTEASPVTWFERGKLAMIAGYRSLVPELRLAPNLDFDVMSMPAVGGEASTVGNVSGLCLSRTAADVPAAADFMVHELSVDSVTRIARIGYLAPANLEVALSDTFLQPAREPRHSTVFNTSIRSMRFAPVIDTLPQLEDAVAPELRQLVYGVGTLDLDALTHRIDDISKPILDPTYVSPSPSPSSSPSAD